MKNKKTKIAILYSGARYFGGIESYLLDLFDNIDKKYFELELLSLGEWQLTEQLKKRGHKVTIFSSKRISPASIRAIGYHLKTNNFGLLVSQGTVANAYARAISLIYKIPNLVTVHSDPAGDYANLFVKILYRIIEKLTRFPTGRYIAVSEYLRNQMIKTGLLAKKISVIYNGVSFPKPNCKSHKGVIIGSAGRLHPVKGFDLLIRAFAKLDNKEARLQIAGEGKELDNLKNLARDLGVIDRVDFVGFKTDFYKFLNTLDIYVQPSISEGFGLTAVQAMSQQLPIVVTPVGSLKEIVKDGKTGLISSDLWPESLARSISQIIDNNKLAVRLGKNARNYVTENFSTETWIENISKAYKRASR